MTNDAFMSETKPLKIRNVLSVMMSIEFDYNKLMILDDDSELLRDKQ